MKTAPKIEIKTWLGGGVVERQFVESVQQAAKLARQTKRDWQHYTTNRVEVSYTGRGGREIYVR